jgi:hypothetical protein
MFCRHAGLFEHPGPLRVPRQFSPSVLRQRESQIYVDRLLVHGLAFRVFLRAFPAALIVKG